MEVSMILLISALATLGVLADETGQQHSYIDRLTQLEEELNITKDSPLLQMAKFKQPSTEAHFLSQYGLDLLEGKSSGKDDLNRAFIIDINCTDRLVNKSCNPNSPYRTVDGSCNNLRYPCVGKSNTVYCRLLAPPQYSDGEKDIRTSIDGFNLTSARNISTTVFNGETFHDSFQATLNAMVWGQFINHDLEFTPIYEYKNNTAIQCCSSTMGIKNPAPHPACLPIAVSSNDPFLNSPNAIGQRGTMQTCMNFVRSIIAPKIFDPAIIQRPYADQLNQSPQWLDGSTIYGSDATTLSSLRAFKEGRLRTSNFSLMPPLPDDDNTTSGYSPDGSSPSSFLCGDGRCNEQPQLAVMHTLWVREHNRVADELRRINPQWSDEILFQEARRIVIAEIQHITYNEFLPVLLGPTVMQRYSLYPLTPTGGYFTGYTNTTTCGPVSNEFSTAAFRMGHSLVQGRVLLYGEYGNQIDYYNMFENFNNPSKVDTAIPDPEYRPMLATTFIDATIRGLLKQPAQDVDVSVVDDLWNQLFNNGVAQWGPFDIVSLNIQRGRDHGLHTYNKYRQYCNLTKFNSFLELPGGIWGSRVGEVYRSVNDIDLYVGGLLEPRVPGGLVGETFACIIGQQFSFLKKSDRFFYELGNQPGSFKPDQLREIRKSSLARIFCDNNDGTVRKSQMRAFVPPFDYMPNFEMSNPVTPCAQIPKINFEPWNV